MHRSWTVTDEVFLRVLRPDDSTALFRIVENNRNHLRRWLPWLDYTRTEADSLAFLRQQWALWQKKEVMTLGIFWNRHLSGVIGFHGFDRASGVTSLGYWLAANACGQGIMSRAVARCLRHAYEEEAMNRVVIRCATENTASRRIPERLGFVHEGTQREAEWLYDHYVDLEMYSLLRREWRNQGVNCETSGEPNP